MITAKWGCRCADRSSLSEKRSIVKAAMFALKMRQSFGADDIYCHHLHRHQSLSIDHGSAPGCFKLECRIPWLCNQNGNHYCSRLRYHSSSLHTPSHTCLCRSFELASLRVPLVFTCPYHWSALPTSSVDINAYYDVRY